MKQYFSYNTEIETRGISRDLIEMMLNQIEEVNGAYIRDIVDMEDINGYDECLWVDIGINNLIYKLDERNPDDEEKLMSLFDEARDKLIQIRNNYYLENGIDIEGLEN